MNKMKKNLLQLLKSVWLAVVLLALPAFGNAQITVTGLVTAKVDGSAIPGVSISVKGTSIGIITDMDGKYSLSVPSDKSELIFSFIGYKTFEIVVGSQTVISPQLEESDINIDEVVVVGYGVVKKSDLTGAVSTVSSEQLRQTSTMNVAQTIQGRVPGVTVTASSGEPGASMKVRIRGIGTLNNSDPLYVVDGIPMTNLSHIAPADIESMEILKDASATAIYGSRGANGVIMITTRKGKTGKATFSYNAFAGIQKPWNLLEVCDAQQYAELVKESFENSAATMDAQTQATIDYILAHPEFKGTDWQQEVLAATPLVVNHNLNINGGTEKSQYNISGTYSRTDGIIKNSDLDKFIIAANNNYKFNNKVQTSIGVNFVHSNRLKYNNDMYSGALPVALRNSPIIPVWDDNTGTFGYDWLSHNMNSGQAVEYQKLRRGYENRIVANGSLTYSPVESIMFKSQFGADLGNYKNKDYSPEYFVSNEFRNEYSSLYEDRSGGASWTWSNFVQW